ncbi:hypothetical protein [Streptomyces sp. NPDC006668]|uniref:hypothetical protein n=1 Tax=Streptomyces sp. NPDC006668 TaxID=3156903 RepID=UPI00340F8795
MTLFRHAHNTEHTVADAHGRHVDFTLTGPTSMPGCPCTRSAARPQPRGRPGAVAVRVAAIMTAGLVASVLLVVVRDIVTTLASTSATGLVLKALLTPPRRKGE